jgi:nucleoside 2-deoxyribosyltransferase
VKVYLAGPEVFLPDAIAIGRAKQQICARHGVTGLYPLDNAVDLSARDASLRIFKGLEEMMDAADAIIANLTPFRGPGADPGTVYELGYMADGLTVEDFGLPDNLMMIHALELHGSPLVMPQSRPDEIWHDLTAFETCVRLTAAKRN